MYILIKSFSFKKCVIYSGEKYRRYIEILRMIKVHATLISELVIDIEDICSSKGWYIFFLFQPFVLPFIFLLFCLHFSLSTYSIRLLSAVPGHIDWWIPVGNQPENRSGLQEVPAFPKDCVPSCVINKPHVYRNKLPQLRWFVYRFRMKINSKL